MVEIGQSCTPRGWIFDMRSETVRKRNGHQRMQHNLRHFRREKGTHCAVWTRTQHFFLRPSSPVCRTADWPSAKTKCVMCTPTQEQFLQHLKKICLSIKKCRLYVGALLKMAVGGRNRDRFRGEGVRPRGGTGG